MSITISSLLYSSLLFSFLGDKFSCVSLESSSFSNLQQGVLQQSECSSGSALQLSRLISINDSLLSSPSPLNTPASPLSAHSQAHASSAPNSVYSPPLLGRSHSEGKIVCFELLCTIFFFFDVSLE
jgi:hypothetical protein